MTAPLLATAWALLLAVPLATRARRAGAGARALALRAGTSGRARRRRGPRAAAVLRARASRAQAAGGGAHRGQARVVVRVFATMNARLVRRRDDAALQRDLPVLLDLLGVAIGAGCTPYLAVEATAGWAPPGVAARLERVLRSCRLGASFPDALDELARATPQLGPVVDALLTSDRLGAPVGPALARLADEERATSRRRAEAHARRVPVRLLFPLVFLVLPAFGLLTVVPALLSGLART